MTGNRLRSAHIYRGRIHMFVACSLLAAVAAMSRASAAAKTDVPVTSSRQQPVPSAPAGTLGGASLSEVVVTATKLGAAPAIDVPQSIQAISGSTLQQQGASGIMSVAGQVPGLSIQTLGPGNRKYVIRGLNSTGSPTIGVYYGEAVITEGNASDQLAGGLEPDIRLYDLSRVEVLRGPQGTLYGANAMSGVIRFIPNEPQMNKVEGYLNLQTSKTSNATGNNYNVNGALNLPIVSDVLALRVVGWRLYDSGYINQTSAGVGVTGISNGTSYPVPALGLIKGVNNDSVGGGRAILRYTPTANLTIDADYTAQSERTGGASYYTPAGETQTYGGAVPPVQGCDLCNTDIIQTPSTDALKVYGMTVRWQSSLGQLTATTHQFKRHAAFLHDSDLFALGLNLPAVSVEPRVYTSTSSEVRFASMLHSPVNFVIGAYRDQTVYTFENHVITANGFGLASGPFSTSNGADALKYPGVGDTLFGRLDHRATTQWATYGQATWKITARWTAVGGVRYFTEDLNGYQEQTHPFGGFKTVIINGVPLIATGVPLFDPAKRYSHVTWMGNLSYKWSRALLAYGAVATGFRSGGLNAQTQPFEPIPPSFAPDTLTSYEFGLKGRLFHDRFEYQADGYLETWNNMQVQETTPGGNFSYQGNAGQARITGTELELRFRPIESLTATLTGAYQHAVLVQGATAFQKQKNSSLGITGDRIPNVPPVQASLRLDYVRALSVSGDWLGTLESDITYRGAENSAFNSDPLNVPLQSYTLLNLRGGVIHGDWTYTLFVDNVTNKRAEVSGVESSNVPPQFFTVQPRTVGLSITRTF